MIIHKGTVRVVLVAGHTLYNPSMNDDSLIVDDRTVFKNVPNCETDKVLLATNDEGQISVRLVRVFKYTDKHLDEAHVATEVVFPNLEALKKYANGINKYINQEESKDNV